jgi:hypothetical protein
VKENSANMSKADYNTAKSRIGAVYRAERSACDAQMANIKVVCIEQAGAKQTVARAELEYGYSADQARLRVAKAEAAYAVAKEKCDDQAGNAKASCLSSAKLAFGKS